MEKAQRQPGIEKAISEINENDYRVRILGTVISYDEENCMCVIDDGTGKAVAFFENLESLDSLELGKLTRIIGKVKKDSQDPEIGIDAEIVQDMNMIDLDLLKRTNVVLEKLR